MSNQLITQDPTSEIAITAAIRNLVVDGQFTITSNSTGRVVTVDDCDEWFAFIGRSTQP